MAVGMNGVNTGNSGSQLRIFDNGSDGVEFIIYCGNDATHIASLAWSGYIGGHAVSGTVRINGAGSYSLGSWTVESTADVGFSIPRTGTIGLGGPTSIGIRANRAFRPSAVGGLAASELTPTSVRLSWSAPSSDGGAAIIDYLLRLNTRTPVDGPGYVDVGHTSARSMVAPSLQPGREYWFAVYARNAAGYSVKSADLKVTMPGRAYVGKGNAYPPAAAVNVGKANAFPSADVLVGKGSSYVPGG